MKRKLQIFMMFVALGVFFCCANASFAQKIVGGYGEASVDDERVVAAADFAVKDHSEKNEVSLEIVSIRKAELQVVAGINYRICIEVKVTEEGNDETQFVEVVVYQDLKKKYKLTSWKPDACGE